MKGDGEAGGAPGGSKQHSLQRGFEAGHLGGVVRCDQPGAVPAARGQLLDQIGAGVRHLVIAALLGDRPVQWLADEIVYPVLAEAGQPVPAT